MVMPAGSVASARAALEADVDIAVIDPSLPDGSGVDLCREFSERHALPVILLASATPAGSAERVDGLEAGALAYLVEPLNDEVLVATVRTVLRNRELRDRLELAVTVSGLGHWEWDVSAGTVSWTESLERMHGFEANSFPATIEAFMATIHPNDRERVWAEMERALTSSGDRFEIAYEFLRTDGSAGHLIGRARILRQDTGEPYQLTGVAIDVTERVASARRNTALVAYSGSLMAADTLARGRAIVLADGPVTVGADVVDVQWIPSDDELEYLEVKPGQLLLQPEVAAALRSGDVGYRNVPGCDLDGAIAFEIETASGIGRLAIGWQTRPDLGDDERRFLQLFANHSVSAIRQLSDYERHRSIGLTLQRALLPQVEPVAGIEVATAFRPAGEITLIGGDWYDVVEIRPGLVAIAIGDVAGHGLEASAAAAAVRHTIRAALAMDDDLDEVLRTVDRILSTGSNHPCSTAAILAVDLATGDARVTLAGHPPPLVRSVDGSTRFVQAPSNPLLGFGLWAEAALEPHRFRLANDDVVVLFTDGAVERRGVSVDRGFEELAAIVGGGGDLRMIVDTVADSESLRDSSLDDDTIVLAARLGR